jgi:hypothetical protein
VASGPKDVTLFPEVELLVLELLPSPPFTHANAATAKIRQIKNIRAVSFVISKFSLRFRSYQSGFSFQPVILQLKRAGWSKILFLKLCCCKVLARKY